jgi:hypothetical protein
VKIERDLDVRGINLHEQAIARCGVQRRLTTASAYDTFSFLAVLAIPLSDMKNMDIMV